MHFLQIKQENIVNIVNWKICKTNLDKLIYLPRISMIHLLRIVFQIFFQFRIFSRFRFVRPFPRKSVTEIFPSLKARRV